MTHKAPFGRPADLSNFGRPFISLIETASAPVPVRFVS